MSALNAQLLGQIIHTAQVRLRWGHRMIHDFLRPKYPNINHKRVYRLYKQAKLAIDKRKKVKRPAQRVPLVATQTLNQTWSMDFVSDQLANGRRIKSLTVADDFSHECLEIATDFGMGRNMSRGY
jgi:putative transposase